MNNNIKTALISVSDKTHLIPFAQGLIQKNIQIISTGGTAEFLAQAGIPILLVSDLTGFPELMEGRVKTLHPKIHAGILGKRDNALHQEQAKAHEITWIDLVVVNLYPFEKTLEKNLENKLENTQEKMIENIDIGGPAMLRAAAKNYAFVTVVHDPEDYSKILKEIQTGGVTESTRKNLAAKVFAHTAHYDQAVFSYLNLNNPHKNIHLAPSINLNLSRLELLRYGENPHQKAALYQGTDLGYGLAQAKILQGKALSYNNLMDAEAAFQCVKEFEKSAAVIVKHANPCGVSMAENINQAYQQAFLADSQSAFGGIVALNQPCTLEIATHLSSIFMEVILAPEFNPEALKLLSQKPNLRVIQIQNWEKTQTPYAFRAISGGLLIQETDQHSIRAQDLDCVTEKKPSAEILEALIFTWKIAKYLKSNAIAISQNFTSLGLSGGQVSRIAALRFALEKSLEKSVEKSNHNLENAVLASDAFFPFVDNIEALKETGIRAIIQPGGSIRDAEIIQACNKLGICMVFTHIRCFNH